jgi:putative transposase
MKAFKYEIKPTEEQKVLLEKHFGCVRFIYNFGLQRKIEVYQTESKTLSLFALVKELTELKTKFAWLNEVNSQALQMTLRNLDNAFTSFFKKNGGFPKFKTKRKSKLSFQCPQFVKIDFNNWLLKLPKFKKPIKIYKDKGNMIFDVCDLKTVTVSKTSTGRYFISCLVDNKIQMPVIQPIEPDKAIGIDLGLKYFCIASNSVKIPNPKYYVKSIEKLGINQKRLAKKVKGSNSYDKQKLKVAKLHEHIKWQRKDFLDKVSYNFVNDSQVNTICMEDLNIKGMVKNRHLSKAISDVGWGMFVSMITYKSERGGKNFIQINRFEPSSKLCNNCGYHNSELKLKDRKWECPSCNISHDRDINAAINIKNFGLIKALGG